MSARNFVVESVKGVDGCPSKMKAGAGPYKGTHERAARKAFTQLCNSSKVKAQCSMIVTVREVTQGSNKDLRSYQLSRVKLATPIQLGTHTIEYGTECKALKGNVPSCGTAKRGAKGAATKTKKARK